MKLFKVVTEIIPEGETSPRRESFLIAAPNIEALWEARGGHHIVLIEQVGDSADVIIPAEPTSSQQIPERFARFLTDIQDGKWEYGNGCSMTTDAAKTIEWIRERGGM
jgi:hypothetical protein